MNPCENCITTQLLKERLEKERTAETKPTAPNPIKPKIKPLDAFAGSMVLLIWIGITYNIVTIFGVTANALIGIAFFWILFVVVFRLVAGGILD